MSLKIAIGFFGITRSLRWTLPSIEHKIIEPLRGIGEVKLFSSLIYQTEISNPRSREHEIVDPDDYKLLKCDVNILHKPGECLEKFNYKKILEYGDAWDDKGKSLSNLIHQFATLEALAKPINSFDPDLIVLIRPDLFYHDDFLSVCVDQLNRPDNCISIPNWQWSRGINDRFAICGRQSFSAYVDRANLMEDYLSRKKRPLHAERFLWWVLNKRKIKVYPVNLKATRIRSNGFMLIENFQPISLAKKIRRLFTNNMHLKFNGLF
jgi:hypothetical protein